MEAKLRAAFSGLKQGEVVKAPDVAFHDPKPGVNFVDKTDINQSSVYLVGLGTERSNPDFYALSVMNEVFSGGFGSRLMQSVRTKLGLAYSVSGSYGASYDHPGLFVVGGRDQERKHCRGDQGDAGPGDPTAVDAAESGGVAQRQGPGAELPSSSTMIRARRR